MNKILKTVCITVSISCVSCVQKSVAVISDPPGAHISFNGNYIGQTPIETTTKASFLKGTVKNLSIVAQPTAEGAKKGQCTQTWTYTKKAAPEKVYFNMFANCEDQNNKDASVKINNYNVQNSGASSKTSFPSSDSEYKKSPASVSEE